MVGNGTGVGCVAFAIALFVAAGCTRINGMAVVAVTVGVKRIYPA